MAENKKSRVEIQKEFSQKEIVEVKAIIDLIKQKDSLIKQKCDFLQTLVDSLPTPIYIKDCELKYKMCNEALSILMGANKESIIGKTLKEIYDDNDESRFMYEKDIELLESGGTQSFDYKISGIGKRPQILNFNRSVFRDEKGRIAGIIGSCFDITDRVKKETELRVEKEKFYNAFDQSPIPKIITKYGKGEILEINESALEMFGFLRKEVIGKSVYDLRTNSGKSLIKDCLKYTSDFFLSKLDTGRIKSIDMIMYTKDDKEKTVALSASKYPVNGHFCILSILKDITDRVIAENEVKKQLHLLNQLMEAIPIPIFYKTTDGIYRGCNKAYANFTGFSKEALIGKTVYDCFPKKTADTYHLSDEQTFKEIVGHTYDFIDDKDQYLVFNKAPYYGTDNKVEGLVGTIFDITDRKKIEMEVLKERDRWEETFNVVPELMAILDDDHTIVRVNKSFADRFNNPADYFVGRKCYDIVHNNVIPEDCPHAQLLADGKQHTQESYDTVLNGYFVVTCSPLFDDENKLVGSVHSMIDITERKKIENDLKEVNEQYQTAIELSNDGVAILQDGKHVFVNKKFLEIFGFKSFDEIIGKEHINVYKNDIAFVKDINTRRTTGQKVPNKYEFRGVKCGDRRTVCVEVSAALINYKGKLATLSYLRDVTERKRYEQFQNLSKEELKNIPEMICRHDSNFKFTYANDTYCKFVGQTEEELIKTKSLFDFIPPEEVERLKDYLSSFSPSRTMSSIVNKIMICTGEIVYVYWINKAFFDEKNKLIEFQSIGRVSDVFKLEGNVDEKALNERVKVGYKNDSKD